MRTVLLHAGYEVMVAVDAPDAIAQAKARTDRIDLLLTDVYMPPGLNGVELAARISHDRSYIRVLLTSGLVSQPVHLEPGWRFLAKPFGAQELLHTIAPMLCEGLEATGG